MFDSRTIRTTILVSSLLTCTIDPVSLASETDPTQNNALSAARAYRVKHGAEILSSYAELLSIPNVATDLKNIQRNADYLRGQLEQRGVEAELWHLPETPPIVFGRLDIGAARTLGIYVHYDGQPVDPTQWSSPPWEPTLYTAAIEDGGQPRPFPEPGETLDPEWRLYGRATGDDKAPFPGIFTALDALQESGIPLTSNLVFLFEGEEEAGSDHLGEYFHQHRDELEVDLWLICDGPVHQSRRPQLVFGVRGYTGLDITVYGATRYLHSGHYGNWSPNPALRLAHLLASMRTDSGEVLIEGFNDSTAPVADTERQAMAALPDFDDDLRRELGLPATEADNASLAERLLIPSLNIRGMQSAGVGDAARNVIPTEATASLDIRLAKGNDPEEMLDLVEAHIAQQGYHIVRQDPDLETRLQHQKIAKVERRSGYRAARTPMDLPVVEEVVAAAALAAGESLVLLPTLGGSLPLYLFTDILQAPVVITPVANHDNNQHAPNENLRLANLWYGIDLMASLLTMPSGAVTDEELVKVSQWMTGSFSSQAQAEANPDHFYDIRLFMTPIWQHRTDGPWLYVEQAAAESLDRPYRQRVYRLGRIDEATLRSDVFTLPGDPLAHAGAWQSADPLQQLSPEDLETRQGCAIVLRRINSETYAGSTRDKDCQTTLRGASYATSDVVLTPAQLLSWDRGFDTQDTQVWGAEAGPYAFIKHLE
jgi:acetylornithine deacetylase/succinyl-diaminopimelate desuccinylase-like protein